MSRLPLLVLGLCLAVNSASAALVVANPDDLYIAGQAVDVSNVFSGVTLSGGPGGHVLALGAGLPDGLEGWFPSVFGHSLINFPSGGCSGCWSQGYAELRADFAEVTDHVEVDFIDRFPGLASLLAYDSSGALVASASAALIGHDAAEVTRLTLTVDGVGQSIAYVVAAADSGTYGLIDRVAWNQANVPEPGSLPLAIAALFGLTVGSVGRRAVLRQAP